MEFSVIFMKHNKTFHQQNQRRKNNVPFMLPIKEKDFQKKAGTLNSAKLMSSNYQTL